MRVGQAMHMGIKNTFNFGQLSFHVDIKLNKGTDWSDPELKSSNSTHTSSSSNIMYTLLQIMNTLKLASDDKFVILSQPSS
jgi:hypothetical protein